MIFLDAFRDFTQSGSYAWGASTLVHMYDNSNDASKSSVRQLAGYITFLHVIRNWIEFFYFCYVFYVDYCFEFFFVFKICVVLDLRALSFYCFVYCYWRLWWEETTYLLLEIWESITSVTYHKLLGRLTSDVVCWIPYSDHRAFGEFKLISLFSKVIRWGPSIVIHRPNWVVP